MNTLGTEIVFVAGIHGNEKAPVDALSRLNVPFMMGNPQALSKNVRYIDEDLNRTFGKRGVTYERQRAKELLEGISQDVYVVDLHTASTVSEPFAIITDSKIIPFASVVGIKKVILFPASSRFISNSLIHKRSGIVVECGNHTDDQGVYKVVHKVFRNCQRGRRHTIKVYEVVSRSKSPSTRIDFRRTTNGLYPVLSGAKSHKGGYLARLIT